MNKYWKAIGITAVTAAILYYPALKLYQYIAKRRAEVSDDHEGGEDHQVKGFSPAYRGTRKHHRTTHTGTDHNGSH